MYAIAFLQGMVFYGSVATLYRQVRGVSILQITVIESISLVLCLLLEFPWGILADRIGYKKTILICNILYFFSKIIFWQADGFPAFLLERIILSVVISGLSGVDTALLYLSCEEEGMPHRPNDSNSQSRSQYVFGLYDSFGTAGLLVAAFLFSTTIGGSYSFSAMTGSSYSSPTAIGSSYSFAAFLTVISYGIAALLSFGLVEVDSKKESDSFYSFALFLKQILTDKYLLLFLIGIALLNETHQVITVFLNQLQYVKCGLSPSAIGYIYMVVTIAGLCSALSSKITGKLGIVPTAVLLFAAAAISCMVLAFTNNAWLSVLGVLVLRVAFGLFQPLREELQNRQIVDGNRATALSIHAVIIDSVGAGVNVAFGSLAEDNLAHAFLFGAALCAMGGLFFYVWYGKK